jgi:hypothetical protein
MTMEPAVSGRRVGWIFLLAFLLAIALGALGLRWVRSQPAPPSAPAPEAPR